MNQRERCRRVDRDDISGRGRGTAATVKGADGVAAPAALVSRNCEALGPTEGNSTAAVPTATAPRVVLPPNPLRLTLDLLFM